jgi:hypothetical protein
MSVKILKTKPTDHFTKVCNFLLQDKRLTIEARFLAIIVNSMPPDFCPTYDWIEKNLHCKRNTSIKLTNNLMLNGMLWRAKSRGKQIAFEFKRFAPTKNFTIVRNDIVRDIELSPEARMILMLVLCQANDFDPYFDWISESINAGKNKTQHHLAELRTAGFAMYKRRKENSEFKTDYFFSDIRNPNYWGPPKVKTKSERIWRDKLSTIYFDSEEEDVNTEVHKHLVTYWKSEFSKNFKDVFDKKFYFNSSMEKDIRELIYIAIRADGMGRSTAYIEYLLVMQVYESFMRVLLWEKKSYETGNIDYLRKCTPAFFRMLINEIMARIPNSENFKNFTKPREMMSAFLKMMYIKTLFEEMADTDYREDFNKLKSLTGNDGIEALNVVSQIRDYYTNLKSKSPTF